MSLLANLVGAPRTADERARQRAAAAAAVALLVLCSMDVWQLAFAAAGALMYAAAQMLLMPVPLTRTKCASACAPPHAAGNRAAPRHAERAAAPSQRRPPTPQSPTRQPSARPVSAPVFEATCFDGEVDDLVASMAPTAESERVVRRLARGIEKLVAPAIPEAKVVAYATSGLNCGAAFRVAVPEVEVVVCASPESLTGFAAPRRSREAYAQDHRRSGKAALRGLTDILISKGPFKFRRSAFRSDEPKVTLHLPPDARLHNEAIPIEVSINNATPGFNAALVTECGQIEPRAKELILLVRRWAKDRGACHASKGHLSPYVWTLLTVFFLQVGVDDEGPLLPPVAEFETSSTLVWQAGASRAKASTSSARPRRASGCAKSVGALFKEFIRFYARRFDYADEAVCIWKGQRAAPNAGLPLVHVGNAEGAAALAAPNIEDPFDPRRNLSEGLTKSGLERLAEELTRADRLCVAGARLGELLEPWVPPESAGGAVE